MNDVLLSILLVVIGLIVGVAITLLINYFRNKKIKKERAEELEKSKKDAEKAKRDMIFEAKEEAHRLKMELDKEIKEKKEDLKEQENRLIQRENNMDKRDETFHKREKLLDEREEKISLKLVKVQNDQAEVEKLKQEQIDMLSKISGLEKEKARDLIMQKVEEEMSTEIFGEVFQDVQAWRKNMVQYLKEENPEINTAILEVAKYDESIDLKAVALGAYISYRLMELATENDGLAIED